MSDAPWIKFYPSDWLVGTSGMSAAEIGVYITLVAMMYEKGRAIVLDTSTLARRCGLPAPSFAKSLQRLIDGEKITHSGGGLFNRRVQDELAARELSSVAAANNARARWQKDKQNQSKPDATVERSASSRSAGKTSDTRYQKEEVPSELSAHARDPSPKDILLTVLDEPTADAVLKHRKAKRAPISTPLAARGLVKAFAEYPGGPKAAAEMMVTNGWTGFKRDYWENSARAGPGPRKTMAQQTGENLRREIAELQERNRSGGQEGGDLFRADRLLADGRKAQR